ncbi:MAG: bifunctional precorrin-2 dehydrogenase/sirohydrochlorin ferrochelatase [Desulfobacterales bacterium]|nr:bifunctional precorrin-2 dehydrogenase/sirohydrochlorin ferrochelatase [Desulfobacterales bacterium]
MRYYPINLNIHGRHCLVVGGGEVASRKVETLLDCGATVTVVSPVFTGALESMREDPNVRLLYRSYEPADLEEKFLVIGATDDMALNRRISADAENRRMLCNIADVPEACNFILPSVIRQGDFVLTISTSGKSPAFAKHLRRRLAADYGIEYARFLQLMGAIRKRLLAEEHAPEAHKHLFQRLIENDLVELIRKDEVGQINRVLFEVLGEGFDYNALINESADSQEEGP